MGLSECLIKSHLFILFGLVGIGLTLIIIGGSLSAWCVQEGKTWLCQSLFHSDQCFSCLFKLLPAGVIFCLILSLVMFLILIIFQIYEKFSDVTKKEYQYVVRLVNVLVLSVAIVLIMIVLLQWFHPPSHESKSILIATVSEKSDGSRGPLEFGRISSNDSGYLAASTAQRQPMLTRRYRINHGPHSFMAAFIILLIALLAFVSTRRLTN